MNSLSGSEIALAVVLTTHTAFRLAYLYIIGLDLRKGESRRRDGDPPAFSDWLSFKRRTQIVFAGDILTTAAIILMTRNTMAPYIPVEITLPFGILLSVTGLGAKLAAYHEVGDKGFYCYNFFCSDGELRYVSRGIYKYLNNPMYGVGYFHAIGLPLLFRSSWGLLFGIFDWAIIWLFYFVFERQHTSFYRARNAARPVAGASPEIPTLERP